jgi:hypothetical protein
MHLYFSFTFSLHVLYTHPDSSCPGSGLLWLVDPVGRSAFKNVEKMGFGGYGSCRGALKYERN